MSRDQHNQCHCAAHLQEHPEALAISSAWPGRGQHGPTMDGSTSGVADGVHRQWSGRSLGVIRPRARAAPRAGAVYPSPGQRTRNPTFDLLTPETTERIASSGARPSWRDPPNAESPIGSDEHGGGSGVSPGGGGFGVALSTDEQSIPAGSVGPDGGEGRAFTRRASTPCWRSRLSGASERSSRRSWLNHGEPTRSHRSDGSSSQ